MSSIRETSSGNGIEISIYLDRYYPTFAHYFDEG